MAAMKILHFRSINDNLSTSTMSTESTLEQKKEFLDCLAENIVKQYVTTEQFTLEQCSSNSNENKTRFACGYQGCQKTFAVNGKCRLKHRTVCLYKDLNFGNEQEEQVQNVEVNKETEKSKTTNTDSKYNYTCSLLRDGLMDWCREDSTKKNDGVRLVRMWRFDMLRFSLSNHTKYRLLAFKLQAQLMALLPPKLAHRLLHNRCVNFHGGKGGNVPGDLALECLNMRAKDALTALHGNLSSSSIQRCGRSLQGCNDILDAYAKGLDQYFGKPCHSKPSLKADIRKFVENLSEERLFELIPGRTHKSFQDFNLNPLEKLNGSKLRSWLRGKRRTIGESRE